MVDLCVSIISLEQVTADSVGDSQTDTQKISVGVPQGSILLWTFIAFNAHKHVQKCFRHCQIVIFADDVALFCQPHQKRNTSYPEC